MNIGKAIEASVVENLINSQRPEQCALLIYTVGCFYFSHLITIQNAVLFLIVWYHWKPQGSDA